MKVEGDFTSLFSSRTGMGYGERCASSLGISTRTAFEIRHAIQHFSLTVTVDGTMIVETITICDETQLCDVLFNDLI